MNSASKLKTQMRSRKSLTLDERINVIRQYEKTPSTRELSIMFKCSLTQIKNILRRKDEFWEEWENNGNLARIKRRQSARFLTVGVIICEWLYRCKRRGKKVNDNLILTMARQVSEKLNMAEVRPGNNWLERMRQKFKLSDEETRDICRPHHDVEESLEMDDIIQDLRKSCPDKNMPASCLAFPYELTRVYLKDSPDEAHDISKVRMRNCLREAKGDKYMHVEGAWTQNQFPDEQMSEQNEKIDLSYIFANDGVTVKAEAIEFSSDSYQSGSDVSENQHALQSEEPDIKPILQDVCIKQEALTKGINSYREAYNILGPMEQFALAQEDVRAVGLINQLENHYRDMMLNGKK